MKRFGAVVLMVVGCASILLGLLFVIGMGGQLRRLLIAALALGLGALAAGFGLRRYKQADAESPEQLRAEILRLARAEDGEISHTELQAKLGRRAPGAAAVLQQLTRDGVCEARTSEGAAYYVFRDLQPRMVIRRCEYCQLELPLGEQLSECPRCGGSFAHRVERQSLSKGSDLYRMDEE